MIGICQYDLVCKIVLSPPTTCLWLLWRSWMHNGHLGPGYGSWSASKKKKKQAGSRVPGHLDGDGPRTPRTPQQNTAISVVVQNGTDATVGPHRHCSTTYSSDQSNGRSWRLLGHPGEVSSGWSDVINHQYPRKGPQKPNISGLIHPRQLSKLPHLIGESIHKGIAQVDTWRNPNENNRQTNGALELFLDVSRFTAPQQPRTILEVHGQKDKVLAQGVAMTQSVGWKS